MDDELKSYFTRMIQSVAEHLDAYPAPIRARIIGVQCPVGKSGDENAYHGTPLDERYRINQVQWLAYDQEKHGDATARWLSIAMTGTCTRTRKSAPAAVNLRPGSTCMRQDT